MSSIDMNDGSWQEGTSEDTDYEMSGQALPVAPFDINAVDESAVPLTSQEYLQQVIAQRSKLPAVVTATVPKLKTENAQKSHLCYVPNEEIIKSELSPPTEWQREQIYNFSRLRSHIECNRETWHKAKPLSQGKNEWFKFLFACSSDVQQQPYLDVVLGMSNETMENLIKFIVDWVIENQISVYVSGTWLFALLACIEVPLCITVMKKLRMFVHKCRNLRQTLDLNNDDNRKELTAQNLFICLIAKYFGQHDLSD